MTAVQSESSTSRHGHWISGTFAVALAGSVLVWCAYPLLSFWPVAWVAPIPWIVLMCRERLTGRRPYLQIWLASWIHWLLMVYFVILPHWAGFIGWIALSIYLSAYPFAFIGLGRILVHRARWPILFVAPALWTALEWVRAHMISGFGMAFWSHTQYRFPVTIQIADLAGGFVLSFCMVFVATCVYLVWRGETMRRRLSVMVAALAVVVLILSYGAFRLAEPVPGEQTEPVPMGIVQGSIDTLFLHDPKAMEQYAIMQITQYRDLTIELRESWPEIGLVIWPESMFPATYFVPNPDESQLDSTLRNNLALRREEFAAVWRIVTGAADLHTDPPQPARFEQPLPMLAGVHGHDEADGERFNSAVLIDEQGMVVADFHKNHLVMFGEFVPFGDLIPFVYNWVPIPGGLDRGDGPTAMEFEGLVLSPSICFESTVGHLIRNHVDQLADAGTEPDVLVNVTNDGWFYGSNCLDLHLACNVFRAVENRKPVIVAANTGFSAHIDGNGRILEQGPRRATGILRANVRSDGRRSPYRVLKDWPAILLTMICLAGLLIRRAKLDRGDS